MRTELDNLPLERDSLERYFHKMGTSFEILLRIYNDTAIGESEEALIIRMYLQRFVNTLRALRIKYLFSPDKDLKIDGSESGFPTHYEFTKLAADLIKAEEKRAAMLPPSVIKRKMVDYIFQHKEDPTHLLPLMAERVYLDELASHEHFLPFTPGQLIGLKEEGYMYHWAAFDSSLATPYIYFMIFDESYDEVFHSSQEAMAEFLHVVKSQGSRAPKLNIFAGHLDSTLPRIHPKMIKRVKIGPFYGQDIAHSTSDEINSLLEVGDDGRKFILFLGTEHLFSAKQIVSKSFFAKGQTREIFHVPEYNNDLYRKGISGEESFVILPYEIHQHNPNLFENSRIFSFDTEGNLNYG